MTARHLMQIAALASALGLTGTAPAVDTDGTTTTKGRASTSSAGMDTPSSGAIVTPEDKAMGLGREDERASNRDSDVDGDTSATNGSTSNDDELSINPGASNDESSMNPAPARTGSDVQPSDMGPVEVNEPRPAPLNQGLRRRYDVAVFACARQGAPTWR